MRAGFSTPLRPTLRLAWEGITHPRWLFGTLPAHHRAARDAAFREQLRHARRADPLAQRPARLLRPRQPQLGGPRPHPRVLEGSPPHREGHPARRRREEGLRAGGGRHHCFQSRRQTARRLDRTASCPARNRRRLRRRARDVRQRRAPRHRCHQGAGTRGKVRIPGQILRLRGRNRAASRACTMPFAYFSPRSTATWRCSASTRSAN